MHGTAGLNPANYDPYDSRVEGLPGEEREDGSDVLWTMGKRICIAAQEEQLDTIARLLDKSVSPNATDSAGYTALHYAARNGNQRVVRKLLDAKAALDGLQSTRRRAQPRAGRRRAGTKEFYGAIVSYINSVAKLDLWSGKLPPRGYGSNPVSNPVSHPVSHPVSILSA